MCASVLVVIGVIFGVLFGISPVMGQADDSIQTDARASAGCEKASSDMVRTGISDYELESGGETRRYVLYVPEAFEPTEPKPLVLTFHGFAGWPEQQMRNSNWRQVADEEGLLVVYPEGTGRPLRWRIGQDFSESGDAEKDLTFISDLVDALTEQFCIDLNRVYANGLSNGGGMSYLLACEMADQFAAVGTVAGAYIEPEDGCEPSRPIPVMTFHGTDDQIVSYTGAQSERFSFPAIEDWVADWGERNGCDAAPEDLPENGEVSGIQYVNCDEDAEVIFYTIDGGGHTWPGSEEPMPRLITGHTTQDIDASAVLWEFFEKHPLGLPRNAQATTTNVVLIGANAEEISFYTVDANGDLQVVGGLPSTFSADPATSHWWIPSLDLFVISPTGERIAFSAKKGAEYGVFIYNVSESNIQEINVEFLALPLWSPDSQYLFLEPRYVNTEIFNEQSYIYDLELNNLYELPQLDHSFFDFQWKPDSSGLIFQGYAGDNCSTYCVEIFSFNLDTQIMKQLTTVEDDLPVNLFPLTCYPTLSNMDHRIYYAVGCIEVGIDPLDYLYSVDAAGNETQVINFLDFGEDVVENDIASIDDSINNTLLISRQTTYGGSGGSMHWLVDSVDETTNIQNLLDITFDEFRPKLYESQLSPNKSHMVLVGLTPPNGVVVYIGDIINGGIAYTIDPQEGRVCHVHWLSNVELIFDVTEANCFHEEYEYSGSLFYHLNIDTEITTEIYSEGQLWVISGGPLFR